MLQKDTCSSAMEAPRATRRALPGLLQQPPDWLYTLIRRVPGCDKLALFQTCRQLARQVMQSAGRITVYARPTAHAYEQHAHYFTLPWLSGEVPSILDVMARVLDFELPACSTDNSFGWARLCNLRELQWHGCISQHDVAQLCVALEQGHLWQLTSFTLKAAATGSDTLYERLASCLGRQLTQLSTSQPQLMHHLPYFQNLSAVWLYGIPPAILATVAIDMNSLPRISNIHTVGDYNMSGREGTLENHSSSGKRWSMWNPSYQPDDTDRRQGDERADLDDMIPDMIAELE